MSRIPIATPFHVFQDFFRVINNKCSNDIVQTFNLLQQKIAVFAKSANKILENVRDGDGNLKEMGKLRARSKQTAPNPNRKYLK